MIQVRGAGRKTRRPKRRAKTGVGALLPSLTALVMALSFVFQLVAIPYHQALVASAAAAAAPDAAQIAADLQATFGGAASLCTQGGDHGGPADPAGGCDDHCPLCQFAAQTTALIAPIAPVMPIRLGASFLAIGAAPEIGAFPLPPTKQSRARAPPFAV